MKILLKIATLLSVGLLYGQTPDPILYQNRNISNPLPSVTIYSESIELGSNVDPTQSSGPVITSGNENVRLISGEIIKLKDGFQAGYSSSGSFKARIDTNFAYGDTSCVIPDQAPFKILYNNDLVNIMLGDGDWRNPLDRVTMDSIDVRIQRTVSEVASHGVDAHFLSIGQGWIPFWESTVYPAKQHYENWLGKTGYDSTELSVWGQYMMDDTDHGDMLETFIAACDSLPTEDQPAVFVSMRLNDTHYAKKQDDNDIMDDLDSITTSWDTYTEWINDSIVDRWLNEKESFFLDAMDTGEPNRREVDWNYALTGSKQFSGPEYKLDLIDEISSNYAIDGFELDFMRFYQYFDGSAQRFSIMENFISDVRRILDENCIRWLCVRIPAFQSVHDQLGLDISKLEDLGVDMVVLSTDFWTMQQSVVDNIEYHREHLPRTKLYYELHYATFWDVESDSVERVPVYKEQLYTTADLAYNQGVDGLSLFNYKYMQSWTGEDDIELAFNYIDTLGDPALVADQNPQWYFRTKGWSDNNVIPDPLDRRLPFTFNNPGDDSTTFNDTVNVIVDESSIDSAYFRLFFKQEEATDASRIWNLKINGNVLSPDEDCDLNPTNSFYEEKFHFPRGGDDNGDSIINRTICFSIGASVLTNGDNLIEITQVDEGPGSPNDVNLYYYDLIVFGDSLNPNPGARVSNEVPILSEESSMDGEDDLLAVRLYPNPGSGKFILSLDSDKIIRGLKLSIVSLEGRSVYTKRLNDFNSINEIVDLSSQSPGIYILKLSNNDFSKSIKLINIE